MSEVTVTPFILSLDVVQSSIDFAALCEYMKTNYKKEVAILNGQDFADSGGRLSKNEMKGDKKVRHDSSSTIAKGIKAKIDADLVKLLDAKKKLIAASEKAAAKAKDQAPKSQSKKDKKSDSRPSVPFDGVIDILYIITNFPYLGTQLQDMENAGVPFDAFFAIVPEKGPELIPYTKKPDKSSRAQQKRSITGFELDYTQNPTCYPPARWSTLRSSASLKTSFIDVPGGEDAEANFREIEKAVINVVGSKDLFNNQFGQRKIINIPTVIPNVTMNFFLEYLTDHADDYMNAIYLQLQSTEFHTAPPPEPPSTQDIYESIFEKELESINRKVIIYEKPDPPDPVFNLEPPPSITSLIYNLKKWEFTRENAAICSALTSFVTMPSNQYAYAGTKFDQIVANANKKYQFGLPPSFFDWSQWNLSTELQSAVDEIQDAISTSSVVETLLDEQLGVLFILTLAPVSRTNGHVLSKYYMPPMIDGLGEYMKNFGDANSADAKKGRSNLSPHLVVKNGGDPNSLLPSIASRFADQNQPIYRLPISLTNNGENCSSYVFESQLRIEVERNVTPSGITFGTHSFFKDLFSISSTEDRIVISVIEGLKVIIEPPFKVTILFIEQSIYYDGSDLILKSSNENAMIISKDNSFVMKDESGRPTIVYPNGTISRYEKEKWVYCDSEGNSYEKDSNGNKLMLNLPHGKITDIPTHVDYHIRPDDIEYYVNDDGSRKIMFRIDFSIDQQPGKTLFDIPQFPIIQAESGTKSMEINRFEISFKDKTAEISCEDYKISIGDSTVFVQHKDTEMAYTLKRVEIKSGGNVFVADADGTERFGEVPKETPKKKADIVKSRFGDVYPVKETLLEPQLAHLHHVFVPRFFFLRDDLSATEYLRYDVLPAVTKESRSTLLHPSGSECKILTRHSVDPEALPRIYIEHQSLSKSERANVMKGLHLPKAAKGKKGLSTEDADQAMTEAETARQSILYDTRVFTQALSNCLERAHDNFMNENAPEPEQEEEKPFIPPMTPPPRILIMQQNKNLEKSNNYWESPEGAFSMPDETHEHEIRPQSPRMALFDPPRFFKEDSEIDAPPVIEEPTPPQTPKRVISRSYSRSPKSVTRPRTLAAQPSAIVFGYVKANSPAKVSIAVTNSGNAPLHYSVTQPKNPLLKVLTPPGVVFPGLKMTLEVELLPGSPQEIIDSFIIRTSQFQMPVPVTATIVE